MAGERDAAAGDALASMRSAAALDAAKKRRTWEKAGGGVACALVVRGEPATGTLRVPAKWSRALAFGRKKSGQLKPPG